MGCFRSSTVFPPPPRFNLKHPQHLPNSIRTTGNTLHYHRNLWRSGKDGYRQCICFPYIHCFLSILRHLTANQGAFYSSCPSTGFAYPSFAQAVKRRNRPQEPNIVLERTGHMRQSSAIVQGIKMVYHFGPVMLGLEPNAIYDPGRGTCMHNVCQRESRD